MTVTYSHPRFAILCQTTDEAASALRLAADVVVEYQHRLRVLEAAPTMRTLRNLRSANYEAPNGERHDHHALRLNQKMRLILTIDESTTPPTACIQAIEPYGERGAS